MSQISMEKEAQRPLCKRKTREMSTSNSINITVKWMCKVYTLLPFVVQV